MAPPRIDPTARRQLARAARATGTAVSVDPQRSTCWSFCPRIAALDAIESSRLLRVARSNLFGQARSSTSRSLIASNARQDAPGRRLDGRRAQTRARQIG